MPNLFIRRYEPKDHDAVWWLHNEALNLIGAHAGNGAWDDDLHAIEQVYFEPGGEFLVGTVDDEVVAMGALKRSDATRGEVKRMRIHPEHQRKGFGQAMLQAIEQLARELGYRTLHLDTTVGQTAAQGLYESNGFVKVGTGRYEQFELLLYEKELT